MSGFGFDKMLNNMAAMKRELPPVIGNQAQRFFVDAFRNQGWTDKTLVPWAPRKDKKNLRPLLTGKSGGTKNAAHVHLRQSVNTSLKSAQWEAIDFSVPQPYAKIHNEGGTIHMPARTATINFRYKGKDRDPGEEVRFSSEKHAHFSQKAEIGAYTIKIPKRQYMGNSTVLIDAIRGRVNKEMKTVLTKR